MERHNGVMIGGTCGAVARAGRLTLLVGGADEPLGPDSPMPVAALSMADELAAIGDWEFETVAAALQAFVIDHDPPGVAALLEGAEETMVFLFDQAEAIEFDDHEDPLESGRVQRGVDRSGWTTELVSGPWVQLRLGLDPVVPWTELRWGLTVGSSALMAIGETAIHDGDHYVYEPEDHRSGIDDPHVEELVVGDAPDELPVGDAPIPAHPEQLAVGGFHEPPEPHPAGSVEATAAETSPHAASSGHTNPQDLPTDEYAITPPLDDLEPDPALDGWDAEGPERLAGGEEHPPEPTPAAGAPSFVERREHDDPGVEASTAEEQESTDDAVDLDAPVPDDNGVQQTVVVDPSQIGLTRLGEGIVHDQPPPPGPPAGPSAQPAAAGITPTTPPSPIPGQPPVPPPSASLDQPPPPGTPPSADQPPPPGEPTSADQPPPPATPPPTAVHPAPPASRPVAPPPTGQPTPSADQPRPPTDQPPPPGAPPSASQPVPPAPPPGARPATEQPPTPGQPPAPPGLGRTLAPGPALDGDRPKPPPLSSPEGSHVEPPPPGPESEPSTGGADLAPAPPPPTGHPLAGPPPTPPPTASSSSANSPAPPGPGAQPLPPPAGPMPPPPGPSPSEHNRPSGPVVGYLIEAEDERTAHPISGTTVIGADPGSDAEVAIGAASTITLDDPSVHEVHVRIKVNGHEVTAEDAGFGESWVQADGGPMKMLTAEGERLVPGCQLRVGHRVLLYRLAAAPAS